jgi:hypothetical protein
MSLLLALAVAAKSKTGGKVWLKAKASARVFAYGSIVAMGLSALAARSAVADVEQGSLRFGRELDKVGDLLGDTKQVQLNGETIYFSQAVTQDDVGTVLDRFQAHCNEDPAMRGIDWDDVATSQLKVKGEATKDLGTLRKESEGENGAKDGVVMCFRRNDKTKTFVEALTEFNQTHDFGSIGKFRYVHVVSKGTGKAAVQVVWTDGSFKVDNVMPPEDGRDAPGSDSTGLPRPERSQRILTATATGSNYAVRMYRTTDSQDVALAAYDKQMDALEWAIIQPPDAVRGDAVGHWYERDGEQTMISVTQDQEGRTVLTIGEMGKVEKLPAREVTE